MASIALYRKWRSRTFDEVVGQQHVTQTLINALNLDRVAHAYLFTGPRGTGKTSTARLLAKAVNCLAEPDNRPCNECRICEAINEGRLLDLIEIDAASNTSVDDIRDLRDKVGFRPAEAQIKFYIIDEVHMLSNSAFNALLKTLEEPPDHVIFVLATTEPEKIPATITSRCQRFDFKRIKLDDIVQRLAYIVAQEGLTAEPDALEYIARQGNGSMRDAISLLDQLTAYGQETLTLELVQTVLGAVASQSVIELVDALLQEEVASGLDIINRVASDGTDPRQFAREIVEYLRALMLVKLGNGVELLTLPDETLEAMQTQAAQTDSASIVRATTLFNDAAVDIKSGLLTIPQLPLELAFVEAVSPAPAQPAPQISAPQPAAASAQSAPPPPPAKVTESRPAPKRKVSTGSGDEITIEDVRTCFEQVLAIIQAKNEVMANALREAQLSKVSGREIYFITSEFMKKRFEKPQPQAAVDEAFSAAIGQRVKVHFLSGKSIPNASQSDTSDGAEDENFNELLKTGEDLGGKVVN